MTFAPEFNIPVPPCTIRDDETSHRTRLLELTQRICEESLLEAISKHEDGDKEGAIELALLINDVCEAQKWLMNIPADLCPESKVTTRESLSTEVLAAMTIKGATQ